MNKHSVIYTSDIVDGKLAEKLSTTATAANSAKLGGQELTDFATAAQGGKADTAVQPGMLHPVASSGDYNSLNNKPNIPEPLPIASANRLQGNITANTVPTALTPVQVMQVLASDTTTENNTGYMLRRGTSANAWQLIPMWMGTATQYTAIQSQSFPTGTLFIIHEP